MLLGNRKHPTFFHFQLHISKFKWFTISLIQIWSLANIEADVKISNFRKCEFLKTTKLLLIEFKRDEHENFSSNFFRAARAFVNWCPSEAITKYNLNEMNEESRHASEKWIESYYSTLRISCKIWRRPSFHSDENPVQPLPVDGGGDRTFCSLLTTTKVFLRCCSATRTSDVMMCKFDTSRVRHL